MVSGPARAKARAWTSGVLELSPPSDLGRAPCDAVECMIMQRTADSPPQQCRWRVDVVDPEGIDPIGHLHMH